MRPPGLESTEMAGVQRKLEAAEIEGCRMPTVTILQGVIKFYRALLRAGRNPQAT